MTNACDGVFMLSGVEPIGVCFHGTVGEHAYGVRAFTKQALIALGGEIDWVRTVNMPLSSASRLHSKH